MACATSTLGFSNSYRRLRNEGTGDEFDEYEEEIERAINHVRSRSWSKRLKRVHIKKRLKINSRLKRFLRRRIGKLFKVSWMKQVKKRLKESQAHFGDLFAGNYLFLQVSPTPFKHHLHHQQQHCRAYSSVST